MEFLQKNVNNGFERRKLIEVALPLEEINTACAREKSIRHGHPSTLHLWWARRPLASCRAVIFASIVDDPSSHPDKFPTIEDQEKERERLFDIIRDLVKWENSNKKEVLEKAHHEMLKHAEGGVLPSVHDPFCGGGSIPLEAQRLGLQAFGTDLNPVPVLITKALIEIPPKFTGQNPINPEDNSGNKIMQDWSGSKGLAADVRYYGKLIRDEAEKRIGKYYPKVKVPKELGGGHATTIAYIWSRTVLCPNPMCGAMAPLARSFTLSKKKGKEAYIFPIIDKSKRIPKITFEVRIDNETHPSGNVSRRGARCIACNEGISLNTVREYGKTKGLGQRLMAIVAEGEKGRLYLSPDTENEKIALGVEVNTDIGNFDLAKNTRDFKTPNYGLTKFTDLYTSRQLTSLATLSNLINEFSIKIINDAKLYLNTKKEKDYSDALLTYLSFGISRLSDYSSSISSWSNTRETIRNTFGRQAIPMTWDFAEVNPFSDSTGNFIGQISWISKVIDGCPFNFRKQSYSFQSDATSDSEKNTEINFPVVCTDPPYYDNIIYSDLSDYFYLWLRQSLKNIYPELFATFMVPKSQELVATPYRFEGNKEKAKNFFEEGFGNAMKKIRDNCNKNYPITVYYAFKQSDSEDEDNEDNLEEDENQSSDQKVTASTGWETMIEGMIKSGLQITATWPIRTELSNRPVSNGSNALASSVVLAARPRPENAPILTRSEFLKQLRKTLAQDIFYLQSAHIAPVDLAQAAIGPGIKVYSKYSQVINSNGTPISVREALQIINKTLDEFLAEQEGEFDAETRWALTWFEQYKFKETSFDEANKLATAKNTSVSRLNEKGMIQTGNGIVYLLGKEEIFKNFDTQNSNKTQNAWENIAKNDKQNVWIACQLLVRCLEQEGTTKASQLSHIMGGTLADDARNLAYRLYILCERKGMSEDGGSYNRLVVNWLDIMSGIHANKESFDNGKMFDDSMVLKMNPNKNIKKSTTKKSK